MATIITRETGTTAVNRALTNTELDNNFINLNTDIGTRILSSEKAAVNGVATLDATGKVPATQLPSYVDDVQEAANLAAFPATGETGKIYVALDTNKAYRWSGSVYVYITSGAVDSVAGRTGVVVLTKSDVGLANADNTADSSKNVLSATKWTTARTISITGDLSGSVSVDGTANASITGTLPATGVSAGSYGSATAIPVFTVDAKGRITAASTSAITVGNGALSLSISTGSTNTAVSVGTGTGFTANSSSAASYTMTVGPALVNLATLMTTAGAGFIRRGATADTYTIDTNTYLTAEADTLATVTARGNSTSTSVTLSGTGNQFGGHFYFLPYDAAGNHYPHFNDGGSASGTKINWRLYTGVNNTVTHTWTTSLATFATNIAASNFSGSSSGTNTGDNPGVTSVAGVTPIISSGGTTPSISHATSGVGAGTYNNVTVNTFGHVTAGSNTAYLTAEADTLATVTARGASTSTPITLTGNLSINSASLFVGRPVSDTSSIVTANTALTVSSLGVDQTAAQTNIMRLVRDGTSGVVYAGAADFDIYRHTTSGVSPNVGLVIRLSTTTTSDYYNALTLESNGTIKTGTNNIFHDGYHPNADVLTTARTIALTGDVSYTSGAFDGSSNITGVATLATVNSNVGTFNNVTVNGKGLVTSASNTAYLTAEADTLATVTGRGASTSTTVSLNGGIASYMGDAGVLFQSYNASAANAAQLSIKHSLGDVTLTNARGALNIGIGDVTTASITLQSDYSNPLILQRGGSSGKGALIMRGADTIGVAIEHGRSQPATDWGTYLAFSVHDNNTSDALLSLKEKVRINATGVGIGTNAPAAKLHVYNRADAGAAPSTPEIRIEHQDINAVGTGGSHGGLLSFYNIQQNNTGWAADAVWGKINFWSSQPSSGVAELKASIWASSDGAIGGTTKNTYIAFATSAGTAVPAERMRITANGGIAFGGAANYGSSGQVLQSNGDAAPTWVTRVSTIAATTPIVTSAATGAITLSHATSGVGAGTYNNVTVNATGHVTAGSNVGYITGYTETDTLATVTGRGSSTATLLYLTGSSASGGGAAGTASIQIQGTGGYQSLELGITGSYDGMLRTYGNDMKYYAGHWRATATATENHSHYWYTSKASSANWTSVKMSLNHDGDLMTLGKYTLGTFANSVTNSGEAWIGRATDRSAGTMTVQLGTAAASVLEVVDYAWSTITLSVGMNNFTYKGNAILHAGNYNSYAPTLTGTGASGTWGISITGNAATATTAGSVTGLTLTSSANGINPDNVTQNQIGYNTSVSLFGQTDGGLYSSAHSSSWIHQIYGDFRTGQIAIRGKNSGTWQAWRTVVDSSNVSSYAVSSISATSPIVASASTGAITLSHANSGVTAGTYNNVTVNTKGHVTAGSNAAYLTAEADTLATVTARGASTSTRVTLSGGVTITSADIRSAATSTWTGDPGVEGKIQYHANRWYIVSDSSSDRIVQFRRNGGDVSYIDNSGNFIGNASTATTATTAITLQTSRTIDGTPFNGSTNIDTTEWYHSGRDFPNGTLITTSIDYSVTNGDPFVLEIRGNSYGNIIPLDLLYQGYIYSDSIINHGGISNGLNITGLVAINVGGKLCFWFPSQGYWNGYNVKVYTAYGTRAINKVTNITGEAKPASTKEVALSANIRQALHTSNYNSYSPTLTGTGASGTWGINVTGTSNNITAYTINQSVGTANGPTFANVYNDGWFRTNASGNGMYNQSTGQHFYSDSTNYWNMGGGNLNGQGIRFRDTHAGTVRGYVYYDQSNNIGFLNQDGSWRLRVVAGDYSLADGSSMRAQLYYDSNDTTYYLDAAGNSEFNRINTVRTNNFLYMDNNYGHSIVGAYSASRYQGVFAMGDSYKLPADGTTTGNLYGLAWSHPNAGGVAANLNTHGLLAMENGTWLASLCGSTRARDDMRAPIFYDNNNTAFYLDPNTTGTSLNVAGSITAGGNITASSDIRLKEDIEVITDAINKVKQITGVTYTRKENNKRQTGVIAQDVLKVLPEAVEGSEDSMYSVAYGNMVGLLIEAIKDQQTIIDSQESRITKLEILVAQLIEG